MKVLTRVAVLLVTVIFLATAAHAQSIKGSQISGLIVSKSILVPSGPGSAVVFTTPATGFFILTQLCVDSTGKVTMSGPTIGTIVHSTNDECTNYTPGIAIPQGEVLTCFNSSVGTNHYCTITGDLVTK